MYKSHLDLDYEISDEVILWRYMDFTKFVDPLAKRALYFARLNTLGDAFEGNYPRQNQRVLADHHHLAGI